MRIIRKVDSGKRTQIRCQHPLCKKKPFLRYLFYTDTGLVIGSVCAKKAENAKEYFEEKLKQSKQLSEWCK